MELDWKRFVEIISGKLTGWLEAGVAHLPNVAASILIFLFFYVAGSIVFRTTTKVFSRMLDSRAIADLAASSIRVFVLVLGLFLALGVLGLQKTVFSLLAGAGILGLAIGFAFQDLAENLIAGFMLGVRKPLQPGDLIRSNNQLGHVHRLNLRNTIVDDFNGQRIYIPNKEVIKNVLENFSKTGRRRIECRVGIRYDQDLEEALSVMRTALEELPFVDADEDVEVWANDFGDSGIQCLCRYWFVYPNGKAGYFEAVDSGIRALKQSLDAKGIVIPYPVRTVQFQDRKDESGDGSPPPEAAADSGSERLPRGNG